MTIFRLWSRAEATACFTWAGTYVTRPRHHWRIYTSRCSTGSAYRRRISPTARGIDSTTSAASEPTPVSGLRLRLVLQAGFVDNSQLVALHPDQTFGPKPGEVSGHHFAHCSQPRGQLMMRQSKVELIGACLFGTVQEQPRQPL